MNYLDNNIRAYTFDTSYWVKSTWFNKLIIGIKSVVENLDMINSITSWWIYDEFCRVITLKWLVYGTLHYLWETARTEYDYK
jgi:hypothetical protein